MIKPLKVRFIDPDTRTTIDVDKIDGVLEIFYDKHTQELVCYIANIANMIEGKEDKQLEIQII